jgi:hypothetical protein
MFPMPTVRMAPALGVRFTLNQHSWYSVTVS